MRAKLIAVACTALFGGCQTTAEKDPATLAQQAVPENYRQLIVQHFTQLLKDPYSVRSAEISPPHQDFTGLINGGYRQSVCVRFNAKNSFGAYIGIRRQIVWFENGKVAGTLEEPMGCDSRIVYAPFPEMEQAGNPRTDLPDRERDLPNGKF